MLKNLLMRFGLVAAPAPYRKYFAASSFVGVVPVAAWMAWRNRTAIGSAIRRMRGHAMTAHDGV